MRQKRIGQTHKNHWAKVSFLFWQFSKQLNLLMKDEHVVLFFFANRSSGLQSSWPRTCPVSLGLNIRTMSHRPHRHHTRNSLSFRFRLFSVNLLIPFDIVAFLHQRHKCIFYPNVRLYLNGRIWWCFFLWACVHNVFEGKTAWDLLQISPSWTLCLYDDNGKKKKKKNEDH